MDAANPAPKNKAAPRYKLLTLEEKIEIIEKFQQGRKNKDLAQEYGVHHSSITYINANKKRYLDEVKNAELTQGTRKLTRVYGTFESAFEQAVFLWFSQQRNVGNPVSGMMLQEKALALHTAMFPDDKNFKASDGWLHRFKGRHNIRCLSLKGEILSANSEDATAFRDTFKTLLAKEQYDLDNVFNADETGLYWKCLPQKTFAMASEESTPGRKVNKERVTLLTCANATGTFRIPLLMIGKSKAPRCFKDQDLPLVYDNQRSSWMDRDVFERWYTDCFIPDLKIWKPDSNEKFLLVLDNAPSHPKVEDLNKIDPQCQVVYLPPNVTSMIQPMDQGVISALKRRYKTALLRELLAHDFADSARVKEFMSKWTLYDCAVLISGCWDSLSQATLKNSWKQLLGDLLPSDVRNVEVCPRSQNQLVELANHVFDDTFSLADMDDWVNDREALPFRLLNDGEIGALFSSSSENNVKGCAALELSDEEADMDLEMATCPTEPSSVFQAANLLCAWTTSTPDCSKDLRDACKEIKEMAIDKIFHAHFE